MYNNPTFSKDLLFEPDKKSDKAQQHDPKEFVYEFGFESALMTDEVLKLHLSSLRLSTPVRKALA